MTTETQVLIAFILYLVFFGWIGARRGVWPEVALLVVTVGGWVLLQERGTVIVRLTNFGGKFLVLVGSPAAWRQRRRCITGGAGGARMSSPMTMRPVFSFWCGR